MAGGRRHAGEPPGVAEGSTFYGYDRIYDRRNLGYRGPSFGLPRCPTSTPFWRCNVASSPSVTGRRSSPRSTSSRATAVDAHPRLIPWDDVGDGSIFDRIPAKESTPPSLVGDAERARAAYGHSIEYSLRTLFSFVQRYGDDNLVLVVLGDHQPATTVTVRAPATTCRSRSSPTTRR